MIAVQQPLIEPSIPGPESELERVRPDPPHSDHGYRAVASNTADERTRRDILESDAHLLCAPLFGLITRTRWLTSHAYLLHDSRRAVQQLRLQARTL